MDGMMRNSLRTLGQPEQVETNTALSMVYQCI